MDPVMTSVEEALYQTQNRSSQDPLNFPVRLNDKLANLMGLNVFNDFPPTDQSIEVRNELFRQVDLELSRWKSVVEHDLPGLNNMIRELGVDMLYLKKQH